MSQTEDHLIRQIEKLVLDTMEHHVAIKGISIGTSLATNIFTRLKPELSNYSETELVAASTSFQYIAKNLFEYLIRNKLKITYVTVDDYILILSLAKDIAASLILDRKLAELEGLSVFKQELRDLTLKISAFVETSELISEDPFVLIKRAIPSATILAIITKEGIPIKIEASDIQEALMSSMVAAISNLTQVILKKPLDYTILQGDGGIILVVQFDESRVLAIVIPESEEKKVGQYLAQIKEIIKRCATGS